MRRAARACSGGGSAPISRIAAVLAGARPDLRRRSAAPCTAASRARTGIAPTGTSSRSAAVRLPGTAVRPVPGGSGARSVIGTAVRSGRPSTGAPRSASTPATASPTSARSTSVTRAPAARATVLTRSSGSVAVPKKRSGPSGPATDTVRAAPSRPSWSRPGRTAAARASPPGPRAGAASGSAGSRIPRRMSTTPMPSAIAWWNSTTTASGPAGPRRTRQNRHSGRAGSSGSATRRATRPSSARRPPDAGSSSSWTCRRRSTAPVSTQRGRRRAPPGRTRWVSRGSPGSRSANRARTRSADGPGPVNSATPPTTCGTARLSTCRKKASAAAIRCSRRGAAPPGSALPGFALPGANPPCATPTGANPPCATPPCATPPCATPTGARRPPTSRARTRSAAAAAGRSSSPPGMSTT
ncbi:Uncharacterised protein [Mycobacterium tuberculosis]|nr:Uncharacterised protein [Mycobacterium tuberculosis]